MKNVIIEELREEHLQAVLNIYNYYVTNTTATFHNSELSLEEMREIVIFDTDQYKSFVIKENSDIYGYVILTRFHKRAAYNGTAEVTVYLKHDCTGKGFGSFAVQFIETLAKEKGYHALLAVICGENDKSIKLFERNGYFKCAHYKEVGKKFGRLLDVVTYEKLIGQ
jgi:L-amino acid N-acyltransferase YncA